MFIADKRTKRKDSNRWQQLVVQWPCIVLVFLLLHGGTAWSSELVHGKYLSSSGKVIQLQITTGTPPPAHIIVAQMIPPGAKVVHSKPQAQKINQKTGEIKWLLKKTQPGSRMLRIELRSSVQSSSVSAVLRYRNPVTGHYVESLVTP